MNFFNAKYSSWQSTKHTVFGYALAMTFPVVKLGVKKEIFFKLIIFFFTQRNGREKNLTLLYSPGGLNVKHV